MSTALQQVASRLSMSETELKSVVMKTVMPLKNPPTAEQFASFIAVANEYGLNPLTKEVYAFPAKGGGIQPIVSVDGWLRIINSHPQFNGMTFEDQQDSDGKLLAVTCNIYRKDTDHPCQVTEYMSECWRDQSEPWAKWPKRMLRHKAAIQAGRYAFGLSGIIDPDEADRFKEAGVIEAEAVTLPEMNEKKFEDLFPEYEKQIQEKGKTHEWLIAFLSKHRTLSDAQKASIQAIPANVKKFPEAANANS